MNTLDTEYQSFADKYEHAHIATPLSVAAAASLARKAKFILEIGAGVGTLSCAMLTSNPNVKIEAYEDSEYCLKEFDRNIAPFKGRFTLHTDLHTPPRRDQYDVVIVDGGAVQGDCGYIGMTEDIFEKINAGIIYFEGVRGGQRKIVRRIMRRKGIPLTIKRIPFQYCAGSYYKGGTLMKCGRRSVIKSWIKYILNEIQESRVLESIFGRIKPPV
jgi:hypothetical protein